ncbi:protein of unknown function [Paraburkholderia dioscoreae]|uniref:Uncharacterized protein n=1 Tax=Paraburkholderia dioscoreae TaxID=2604047 RepID=A0A5Q4ZBA4_9BURK|nr:protein of unknown function [Paraburkholderia dioscoreae]
MEDSHLLQMLVKFLYGWSGALWSAGLAHVRFAFPNERRVACHCLLRCWRPLLREGITEGWHVRWAFCQAIAFCSRRTPGRGM